MPAPSNALISRVNAVISLRLMRDPSVNPAVIPGLLPALDGLAGRVRFQTGRIQPTFAELPERTPAVIRFDDARHARPARFDRLETKFALAVSRRSSPGVSKSRFVTHANRPSWLPWPGYRKLAFISSKSPDDTRRISSSVVMPAAAFIHGVLVHRHHALLRRRLQFGIGPFLQNHLPQFRREGQQFKNANPAAIARYRGIPRIPGR